MGTSARSDLLGPGRMPNQFMPMAPMAGMAPNPQMNAVLQAIRAGVSPNVGGLPPMALPERRLPSERGQAPVIDLPPALIPGAELPGAFLPVNMTVQDVWSNVRAQPGTQSYGDVLDYIERYNINVVPSEKERKKQEERERRIANRIDPNLR